MTDKNAPRPVTPMSILAARIDHLAERAALCGYDDAAFCHTLSQAQSLAQGLEPYLDANTTACSTALAELAAATQAEDWRARFDDAHTGAALEQEMLSGHVEGQFLKMLVAALGARSVLEVGLFTGYSALAMAEALPADGRLVACEIDEFAADFAARHVARSPHGHKIEIRRGPAAQTLQALADAHATFDLVFIDADKAGYPDYLRQIVDAPLLAANGLICVDNTLLQGEAYLAGPRSANGEAIAAFNQGLAADTRLETVLLPLRDGLTLIRRAEPAAHD